MDEAKKEKKKKPKQTPPELRRKCADKAEYQQRVANGERLHITELPPPYGGEPVIYGKNAMTSKKLNEATAQRFLDLLKAGVDEQKACEVLDWNYGTLKAWLKAGTNPYGKLPPDNIFITFRRQYLIAKESVTNTALKRIVKDIENEDSASGVKTAQWYLEKIDPRFMPKSKVEHENNITVKYAALSTAELYRRLSLTHKTLPTALGAPTPQLPADIDAEYEEIDSSRGVSSGDNEKSSGDE